MTASLVFGSGGLLGSAVARYLRNRGDEVIGARVRWRTDAAHDVTSALSELRERGGGRIFWCAGAGVTATQDDALAAEVAIVRHFAAEVRDVEAVFFASSAGGIYAGAANPPFDEETPPRPLAPYGRAKLAQEQALSALTDRGIRLAIGRLSNLHGPGQNLAKAQGLVSRLCVAAVDHQPVSIYVSLDTRRDYLYVDDGAALVCDFVDRAVLEPPGSPPIVKILASGQSVTIATLLGEFRRLTRQGLRVVVAPSAAARAQAHDLRFCSRQWPELDRRTMTPLPVAIAATLADIQRRVQRGTLLPVGSAGT